MKRIFALSWFGILRRIWLPLLVESALFSVHAAPIPHPEMVMPESPDAANTFLVAGPFAYNGSRETSYIGDEKLVAPELGAAAAPEVVWEYFDDRLFSRNYDDYQDLFSYLYVKQGREPAPQVMYAHTYVYAPRDLKAVLSVGADTWIECFLNGVSVLKEIDLPDGKVPDTTGERDTWRRPVQLKAGWNRLLVKVGNTEAGRLGFYLRFTTPEGKPLPEVNFSALPPTKELTIQLPGTADAVFELPMARREWPYVGMRIDVGNPAFDPMEGDYPQFMVTPKLLPNASDYRFVASGGVAPYHFSIGGPGLVPGLQLHDDGRITGTPEAGAALGDYEFTVCVTDAAGGIAERRVKITLAERPNRWYEQARIGSLIHNPTGLPAERVHHWVEIMKQQGYRLVVPIAYNNGCMRFYWPSPFNAEKGAPDYIQPYKDAADELGLKFGLYIGNLNNRNPQFTPHQQNLMMLEALRRFRPALVWFDWAGLDGTSMDALYSMMKSFDPEIIVLVNCHVRGTQGDWDMNCVEGYGAWGSEERDWWLWPIHFPWPKRQVPETWRKPVASTWVRPQDEPTPWDACWRICLTLIGEGFVSNIDHTLLPADVPYSQEEEGRGLMELHHRIARWASPEGIPPLYEAYTEVEPGPLPEAFWGYDLMSTDGNNLYLLIMKNRHGKTGLPDEPTLTLWPIDRRVEAVIWMNRNQPLSFEQRGTSTDRGVTIDISKVENDPVAVIIKLELAPENVVPKAAGGRTNLAAGKPAEAWSVDGKRKLPSNGGRSMKMGVDGDPGSVAQARMEYAWSYRIDLEMLPEIREVVVTFDSRFFATHFQLLGSRDGKRWQLLAEEHSDQGGTYRWRTDAPERFRYIEVRGLKPDRRGMPGNQMAIAEVEVYAD